MQRYEHLRCHRVSQLYKNRTTIPSAHTDDRNIYEVKRIKCLWFSSPTQLFTCWWCARNQVTRTCVNRINSGATCVHITLTGQRDNTRHAYPRAVVVHHADTATTHTAVVCSPRFVPVAFAAVGDELPVYPLRFVAVNLHHGFRRDRSEWHKPLQHTPVP